MICVCSPNGIRNPFYRTDDAATWWRVKLKDGRILISADPRCSVKPGGNAPWIPRTLHVGSGGRHCRLRRADGRSCKSCARLR